jgi:predicted nucleic acid-binding protein
VERAPASNSPRNARLVPTTGPIREEIAQIAGEFSTDFPDDPADRIIAATAQVLRAKLITADDKLRSIMSIDTIW